MDVACCSSKNYSASEVCGQRSKCADAEGDFGSLSRAEVLGNMRERGEEMIHDDGGGSSQRGVVQSVTRPEQSDIIDRHSHAAVFATKG